MPNTAKWANWTWKISTESETLWQVYEGAVATSPLGNGWICLSSPVLRLASKKTSAVNGSAIIPVDFTVHPASTIVPLAEVGLQFWFRDQNAGGSMTNLSEGLRLAFCP